MALEIGSVYDGKVTGIMKFGAFVALPEGKSGLCHISEISGSFVSDINDHLKVDDAVRVKIVAITPEGKINLSIKKAEQPAEAAEETGRPQADGAPFRRAPAREKTGQQYSKPVQAAAEPTDDKDFESKLKKFMQESDSRIADNPRYADRPRKNRRR